MTVGVGERTRRMCEMFKAGTKVADIAAAMSVQNPAVYRALRRGGALPPCGSKVVGGHDAKRGRPTRKLFIEKPEMFVRVDRDPCTYCGVRADFGCRHNRSIAA